MESLRPPQVPRTPSPQSNNPYFQHLAGEGQSFDSSYLSPYPEAGPPSYDVVTSPVPSPVDGKSDSTSYQGPDPGVHYLGDAQPSQMSRSPQPSHPIEYSVASPSQQPTQSQTPPGLLYVYLLPAHYTSTHKQFVYSVTNSSHKSIPATRSTHHLSASVGSSCRLRQQQHTNHSRSRLSSMASLERNISMMNLSPPAPPHSTNTTSWLKTGFDSLKISRSLRASKAANV